MNCYHDQKERSSKMKQNLRFYITILVIALCVPPIARAQEFAFETIDPPGGPSPVWNHASGINNLGQIVGGYLDGDMVWHAYLFHKDIYTEMSDPDSLPMGIGLASINDDGQMPGNSIDEGDPWGWAYGVLFDRGALTRILSIPNGKPFFTFGINNRGQITGTYGMSEESDYWSNIGLCGFLLDGDTLTDISPPDADSTVASIVNDHGQIVGDYRDVNGEVHGFLLDGQEFITLDFPGASWTRANGINDHGQIVGNYMGEDRLFHGFMAEIAHMTPAALSSRSKVSTTWGRIKAE